MIVTLVDSMGNDLRIYEAAQASLNRTPPSLDDRAKGVIRYMLANHHGTPFEHVLFTFYIETSIKVARDMFRHRTASFNERSTRYMEMPESLELPEKKDMRTQVGRPGHYTFETMERQLGENAWHVMYASCLENIAAYKRLLRVGVAREIASGVLPLWLQTSFLMTLNLRSLFNFLAIRMTGSQALRELTHVADEMYELVAERVPAAMDAWEKASRPNGDQLHDCDQSCSYHVETS